MLDVLNIVTASLTPATLLFSTDEEDDDPTLLELLDVLMLVAAGATPTDAAAALNASLSTIDWIRLSSTLGVAVEPETGKTTSNI